MRAASPYIVCLLMSVVSSSVALADDPALHRVIHLSAEWTNDPAGLRINWSLNGQPTNWIVQRKNWLENGWNTLAVFTNPTASSFTDTNAMPGQVYEYKVTRLDTATNGWGFLLAGHERPLVSDRGTLVLVVESNLLSTMPVEIQRLRTDLMSDGWRVAFQTAPRTEWNQPGWASAVSNVKESIRNVWLENTSLCRAVFLLGHVPVPYSGDSCPDGHTNNHRGAWPADAFYGDMDGVWPDQLTSPSNSGARLYNQPGDGKFDVTWFAEYDAELMVGRVDFASLPAFVQSETELLRQYLAKSRRFRKQSNTLPLQGKVRNNFPTMPEAFAQVGFRDYGLFFGPDQVQSGPWFSDLRTNRWMAAYGCGAGSFTNCSGVANVNDFATGAVRTVFTMLLGSYFGDWDVTNNLLRAAIASMPDALTCVWAGRPKWFTHVMDLGEPIGSAFLMLHRPAYSNYEDQVYSSGPHAALLGDPTLRLWYSPAPVALTAFLSNDVITLTWTDPAPGQTTGYIVQRAATNETAFSNLHSGLWISNSFSEHWFGDTAVCYAVRAARRETVRSGTFTNLSLASRIRIEPDGSINRPPVVSNRTFVALMGQPLPFSGAGHDPDGDPIAFALHDWPDWGTITGKPPHWVWMPPPNFTGTVALAYDATDGWNDSEYGILSLTVAPSSTLHGVPVPWLIATIGYTNDYNRAEQEDPDEDGQATWQEYFAGTDPLDGRSVFRITDFTPHPGSNYLLWYATTNSGVFSPFTVERAFALDENWVPVVSNIPRSASGWNEWWDTNSPPRIFYRIRIP